MRMLHPINGALGLFLPFETCSNSTSWCKKNCYQKLQAFPRDDQKLKALLFLINKSVRMMADLLAKELNGKILHWFVSGDCWGNYQVIGYFDNLIKLLHHYGIDQCGFTRNEDLWLKNPDHLIYSRDPGFDIYRHIKTNIERNCEALISLAENHNLRIAIPKIMDTNKQDCGVNIYRYVVASKKTKKIEIVHAGGCGPDIHTGQYREEHYYSGKAELIKTGTNCEECRSNYDGCFKRKPYELKSIKNNIDTLSRMKIGYDVLPDQIMKDIIKVGVKTLMVAKEAQGARSRPAPGQTPGDTVSQGV